MVDALRSGGVQLSSLNIGINELGDAGCEAIAEALGGSREGGATPGMPLSSVRYLSLRRNGIANIAELCRVLPKARLRELDLRENNLGDDQIRRLLNVGRGSPPILVRLTGNQVADNIADLAAGRHFDFTLGHDEALAPLVAEIHQIFDESSAGPNATVRPSGKVPPWMCEEEDPVAELAAIVGLSREDLLHPRKATGNLPSFDTGSNERPLSTDVCEADYGKDGIHLENDNASTRVPEEESTCRSELVGQTTKPNCWNGVDVGEPFDEDFTDMHMEVSHAEWKECLEALKFMESCILK